MIHTACYTQEPDHEIFELHEVINMTINNPNATVSKEKDTCDNDVWVVWSENKPTPIEIDKYFDS